MLQEVRAGWAGAKGNDGFAAEIPRAPLLPPSTHRPCPALQRQERALALPVLSILWGRGEGTSGQVSLNLSIG